MERRLQLLLDEQRYDRVQREAARSGRSVAAVIREAIDVRFADDADVRRDALGSLLERVESRPDDSPGEDWADIKDALEADLDRGHVR